MIDKIIDNYISKKLIRCMKSWVLIYNLDFMTLEKNGIIKIYIKQKKYNNKQFKNILSFEKKDSILLLSNLIETKREFIEIIKKCKERGDI